MNKKVKLKSLYNERYDELNILKKVIVPLNILVNKKKIYNKYIRENYNTEIAFLEGPITRLFSTKNNDTKKIAWVHNDISKVFGKGLKAKIKIKIDKKIYSKYDKIIFVSKDNLNKFENIYADLDYIKKEVIYNYIDKETVLKKAQEKMDFEYDNNTINIVTVARLVPQKAIDRVIKVHGKLIKEGIMHHFYVIGDGPERKMLENMVKQYNLADTFHLLGQKENPYPYIKNADYFCLLSKFEGYGMVLEEAKILNKSIIITDTAARETVLKYENARIIQNTEDAIYSVLENIILYTNTNKQSNIETGKKVHYDNMYILNELEHLLY